jgi:TolB-like protein/Tfp pilus assembly protein PilF
MAESTTTPGRAVFLSYAREDTGAASLVAEALRRAGVEVWFDQSELRGGDAWDQKIRRQIRDCILFLPLISAVTQRRPEGYFRREWRQAADRTRDMAGGMAFILPVVIDDTRENDALVPEEFMRVQWTRLPEALPTPQFTRQVKQLLDAPRVAATGAVSTGSAPATSLVSRLPFSWPPVIVAAAAVVALAGGLWYLVGRPAVPAVAAASAPAPAPKPAVEAAPKVDDKSIAVLPFANMSDDKDAGYFADGVHEDLLTNLATIAELKVISRTSVMQYRGTTKTIRQIGRELGVAYVLEGSVRRAGDEVRVTGQLINTGTDEHVWAKAYDRKLTDIFSIQSALAQEIATALSAAISPEAKKQLDRRPTNNPAAYELFLKARDFFNRSPIANPVAMQKTEELYQAVVDLDPNFADAWGELANIHALNVFWGRDGSPARLARGEAAIARAAALAPDSPEIIGDIGTFAYYAHRDYEKAVAQYKRLAALQPNNPVMHHSLGLVLRREGRWADALVSMRRAVELDPASVGYLRNMGEMCFHLRRWDEDRAYLHRVQELLPGNLREELFNANVEYSITGTLTAFDELWAKLTPAQREQPLARYFRKNAAMERGDTAEFKRLDALQPTFEDEEDPMTSALNAAAYLWGVGEKPAAAARAAPFVDQLRHQVETEPGNLVVRQSLGQMLILTGHGEEGLALLEALPGMLPTSKDAIDGPNYEYSLLEGYAMVGQNDKALAGLPAIMREPSLTTPATIRDDPCFAGLKSDPRFQAILADPANNKAPLY